MHNVVEPTLEERHQRFTGIPLSAFGTGEVGPKLSLKNTVIVLYFLLLTEMNTVLSRL